jgi:hypothetical protein
VDAKWTLSGAERSDSRRDKDPAGMLEFQGSGRGSPANQGRAPEPDTHLSLLMGDLDWRGARYPAEKARRPGLGFCGIWAWIFREV